MEVLAITRKEKINNRNPNWKEKKNRNPNWKEEEVIFADSTILYIGNPNDAIRKLLGLINEFSKVSGYKINIQKYLAFLYTINERSEREIQETIPFTIETKRTKYLGINLPKEAKDLYIENTDERNQR